MHNNNRSSEDYENVMNNLSEADDQRAELAEIFENYFRVIFNYCSYRLFRKDLAEEATCEVFLQLVRRYPSLREGPLTAVNRIKIRNWLYGTASNIVARYIRDSSRFNKVIADLAGIEEKSYHVNPSRRNGADWSGLYKAINKLKIEDQELVSLRYFVGLRTSEIAEMMGRNHNSIRVRLLRVIKKLRETIGDSIA